MVSTRLPFIAPAGTRAASRPAVSPRAPAANPDDDTEKAAAALPRAAAEPNGLRTKHTAAAVSDALKALQPLDYADLLDLAKDDGIPRGALPDVETFNALDLKGMELWESL